MTCSLVAPSPHRAPGGPSRGAAQLNPAESQGAVTDRLPFHPLSPG